MRSETSARVASTSVLPRATRLFPAEKELKARFVIELLDFDESFKRGSPVRFKMVQVGRPRGVRLTAGTFRKDPFSSARTTIQVDLKRVVIRLEIVGEPGKRDRYFPVGIAFERADETCPIGRPWTTAPVCLPGSPFCAVKFNDPPRTIEITDVVTKVRDNNAKYANGTHRTYRFTVYVQEALTGRVGAIDPEIENSNVL